MAQVNTMNWKSKLELYDDRRDFIVAGNKDETIAFCVQQLIELANHAIKENGKFFIAVSGGSTPNAIYKELATNAQDKVDWKKVYLFWSDERSVPPSHPDSNYTNAMEAGLKDLPIPKEQIFRMVGEGDIEANARNYEELIKKHVPHETFDVVMLGMGEDGHTASLFPKTHGLHADKRQVIGNYVPRLDTWRMSLTYDAINHARFRLIYVIGKNKAEMVKNIFTHHYSPDELPIQRVGTPSHKAIWIFDKEAISELNSKNSS
jgi:6-phosphogluconolactonase